MTDIKVFLVEYGFSHGGRMTKDQDGRVQLSMVESLPQAGLYAVVTHAGLAKIGIGDRRGVEGRLKTYRSWLNRPANQKRVHERELRPAFHASLHRAPNEIWTRISDDPRADEDRISEAAEAQFGPMSWVRSRPWRRVPGREP